MSRSRFLLKRLRHGKRVTLTVVAPAPVTPRPAAAKPIVVVGEARGATAKEMIYRAKCKNCRFEGSWTDEPGARQEARAHGLENAHEAEVIARQSA